MNTNTPLESTLQSLHGMGKTSIDEEYLIATMNGSTILPHIRNNRIKCELLEYKIIAEIDDDELKELILKALNNLVTVDDSVEVTKILNNFRRYKDLLFSIKAEIFFKLVENNSKDVIEVWIRAGYLIGKS